MFNLSVPWWELLLRAVTVYVFLIVLLRVTGKRQVGQLAPIDLVLLLVLSNSVQNAMNGGDNSLVGGLLSAGVLVGLNYGLSALTYRSRRLESWIEGQPEIIIHNGKVLQDAMTRTKLTHRELNAAIREAGCATIDDVKLAVLEATGEISVISRAPKTATDAA
ncbi:MAG: YetF domain-containing protein [Thermoflexales bacterium]